MPYDIDEPLKAKKLSEKEILKQKLLFFHPEIVFDGKVGGTQLIMEIDAFNNHINWSVQEGDHYIEFMSFVEAVNYYVGEKYES